jgi:hypothetical protein
MIGSRATVGLLLLCALIFSAFAAPGASAKGTTAFTCVSGGGALDFSDAHCDNEVTSGTGSFGHVSLGTEAVKIQVTNEGTKGLTTESTPVVLNATLGGMALEIVCSKASGTSVNTNKEISGVMQNEGKELSLRFFECTVVKPAKCTIKGGEINVTSGATTITVENVKGTEMGLLFSPEAGKPFFEVTLEGPECPLKGKTASVVGTTTATGPRPSTEITSSRGATMIVTKEMTAETLKIAGAAASVSAAFTVKTGSSPVTLTTTSP